MKNLFQICQKVSTTNKQWLAFILVKDEVKQYCLMPSVNGRYSLVGIIRLQQGGHNDVLDIIKIILKKLCWQQVALENDTFTPHSGQVGLFHSPVTSPWSRHAIHIWGNATNPSLSVSLICSREVIQRIHPVPPSIIHLYSIHS